MNYMWPNSLYYYTHHSDIFSVSYLHATFFNNLVIVYLNKLMKALVSKFSDT